MGDFIYMKFKMRKTPIVIEIKMCFLGELRGID